MSGRSIDEILGIQRRAFLRDGPPTLAERKAHLSALEGQVRKYQRDMGEVLSEDFGNRSRHETLLAETMATVMSLKHAKKHLASWMRPARRPLSRLQHPFASAAVHYQPLGVIGIMAPWNYPFQLALVPLGQALAAGNRVMLKPSEFTPGASALMARMLGEVFSEEQVAVIEGGPDVAAEFSRQKFDHLMFTGSTATGRRVMMAAAENLVPVTLELGGKSPVIIGEDYDLDRAAGSIALGKMLNAGQTCIAPDYVFVPEGKADAFARALSSRISGMYPTLAANPDYTSIVADRHFERINGLIEDARARGARIEPINPGGEDLGNQRKIAPTLILDVTDDMKVMQEEIFGPVLPVKTYGALDEAIDYINAHDRPLALYHFSDDKAAQRRVIARTTAGGMTVNDTILHVAVEELPFGGVGPSGIGAYHGEAGFRTFSHAKSVLRQSRFNLGGALRPPFGAGLERIAAMMIGK
ncbi:coniferyl aldehyde dehydrogenase [Iodidimonas sp. SYSU 1G8]|uniref:coniferyl aldehyde dehydrogenase n=1 Tax=Iodidimonas sp. SYSU 1G8 TaxID=3133967 RepID=UPI0031FE73AB